MGKYLRTSSDHDKSEELRKLILDKERQLERECKEYLKYAPYLLFKDSSHAKEMRSECEYRTHVGDSDYIISGKIADITGGQEYPVAYLWELKAPQCYMFVKDSENKSRLRPSGDLYDAENKLLYYWDYLRGDTNFKDGLKITRPENVKLGGIIIGSKTRLVKGKVMNKSELLQNAYRIRKYIYDRAEVKLITWDDVLGFMVGGKVKREEPQETFIASELPEIPKGTVSTWDVVPLSAFFYESPKGSSETQCARF